MSNKYSIVTGASRGLGAAIAEELAREGYDVVITYGTQADKAQKVKKQLETKFGVRVESYQLDIKDEEAVLAFRKWAEETLGTNLQVLVNNAGIYANVPAEEIASKTFCDIIDVNVKGTFFMTRHFVDLMIANHYGKIINLCSAVGLRAAPGSIAYASSKFAIRGMTQALAIDLGKYNIQVNAIAPGAHKTDMYWEPVRSYHRTGGPRWYNLERFRKEGEYGLYKYFSRPCSRRRTDDPALEPVDGGHRCRNGRYFHERPAFWRNHDRHLLRRVLHHVQIAVPTDFFRKPSGADL